MRKISIAEMFSNMGRAAIFLYFSHYLFSTTGVIWGVGLVLFLETLTSFLGPLIAGKIIDRYKPIYILKISSSLLVVVGIFSTLFVGSMNDQYYIALISFVFSVFYPFIKASVFCITPQLEAEGLSKANGQLIYYSQLGQFSGMALAAWMMLELNLTQAISVTTLIFFFACLSYFSVEVTRENLATNTKSMAVSGKVISRKEWLSFMPAILLSISDLIAIFIFNVLLAALVTNRFHGQSTWMSILDACFALGAAFGGWSVMKYFRPTFNSSVMAQALFCIYLLAVLFSNSDVLIIASILVWGASLSTSRSYWNTVMHSKIPSHNIGFCFGIQNILASSAVLIVNGVLSTAFNGGFEQALIYAFLIMVFITCSMVVVGMLRSFRAVLHVDGMADS
ncbi:MFS transporter [Pseudomonas alliivorans]|nr:MFS transporter [Pseudomonas alliivorans]